MADVKADELDDDGTGFDPVSFANSIYKSIAPYRSKYGPQPFTFVESPASLGASSGNGENRINTFYRMLGLPATRDESFLNDERFRDTCNSFITDEKKRNRVFSQDGTINYFYNSSLKTVDDGAGPVNVVEELAVRNQLLTKEQTPEDFDKMMKEPIDFTDSITVSNRKASIFPLVVDASIPTYPLNKRVAPLFYDGDYVIGASKTRLSRPFIENIIYIRTRVISGGGDTSLREDLVGKITEATGGNETDLTDFTNVELVIQQRILQALKKLASEYKSTIDAAEKIKDQIAFSPAPTVNPEQRSGITDQVEQTTAQIEAASLDKQIATLKQDLVRQEAFRYVLPTEQVSRADRIRRQEEDVAINNFREDVLVPTFTDLITYKENQIRRQITKLNQKRVVEIKKAEKIKRDLMYYTGEFVGLSIFDIICILYGLFTVDLPSLIGLLNEGAQTALANNTFYTSGVTGQSSGTIIESTNSSTLINGEQPPNVSIALGNVQKKVLEAFIAANTFASQDDRVTTRRR